MGAAVQFALRVLFVHAAGIHYMLAAALASI